MIRLLAAVLAALLAGCVSAAPFKEAALVPLESADPHTVVERFRSGNAESFQLLNTIVFEYSWFTFGGIGYLEVNAKDRFYKVACMNHMGVKLFEVSGNRDGVLSQSAIGPLADRGDIARAVGDDIMRVYFDLVPSDQARIAQKKNRLVFRQPSEEGALEYVFAGEPTVLRTKTYYEDNRAVWRVSYYDYLLKNEKQLSYGHCPAELPARLPSDCQAEGDSRLRRVKEDIEQYMTGLERESTTLTSRFSFPPEFIGFQGHFPSKKILPGVCQIQCALSTLEKGRGKGVVLERGCARQVFLPVVS